MLTAYILLFLDERHRRQQSYRGCSGEVGCNFFVRYGQNHFLHINFGFLSHPYFYANCDLSFEPDYAETACCSSDGIDDGAPEKLTRAQRKRIRKRKLKEAASSRRRIIGPLLPSEYELPGMKNPQTNDVDVDAPETNVGSQDTSHKT